MPRIFRRVRDMNDFRDNVADGEFLVRDGDDLNGSAGGGGGAPTTVDYLVGTADGGLSAEIVVGTSPGGELGGTWASPTVDASHSGSTHAAIQAAAEATAASALTTHSADTTAVHGIVDTSALALTANHPTTATFNDHSARHEDGGADEITLEGLSGTPAALTTHEADTTNVHGFADTSAVALTADVVTKALYDANTVLTADSDNTPAALTMGASTILARLAAGNIVAATPAQLRTLLALVIGTNVQAWDADLDTYAGITPSANTQSLLAAANYAAMRALLDLEAGTDFPSLTVFNDHNARHEDGGADEITIAGLAGIPTELQTHMDDVAAAHAATAISFSPDGSIAATTVQAAIVEVRDEASGGSAADNESLILHMAVFA